MAVEVKIPSLGESVTEAVIGRWLKQEGEPVAVDEPILEIESDKANMELAAEQAGALHIVRQEGETVSVGDIVATIDGSAAVERIAASGDGGDFPPLGVASPATLEVAFAACSSCASSSEAVFFSASSLPRSVFIAASLSACSASCICRAASWSGVSGNSAELSMLHTPNGILCVDGELRSIPAMP